MQARWNGSLVSVGAWVFGAVLGMGSLNAQAALIESTPAQLETQHRIERIAPTLVESSGEGTPVSSGVTSLPTALPQASPSSAAIAPMADGVYLYGQAPQPDQLGQGYFVFEVSRGSVVGALYMPRSSFDCAKGSFQDQQLALTVVNSYDRSTNAFEIALERSTQVAGQPVKPIVGLEGFHRLEPTENDLRMLKTCKADFQK